jgi:hypothetical protein
VIKAPIAAPRAKAHAERWVGSVRRECLDRILIVSRRQLETVLREYVAYYNTHRPHRSLDQQPPLVKTAPIAAADHEWRVHRRDGSAVCFTSTNSPRSDPLRFSNRQPVGLRQRLPEAPARSSPAAARSRATRCERTPSKGTLKDRAGQGGGGPSFWDPQGAYRRTGRLFWSSPPCERQGSLMSGDEYEAA